VLLDRIDGLQTQVATAETETETARTAVQAADVLRKTGGERQSCAREGSGASQGSMAAGAMAFGLGGTTAGGVTGE
jgi:hypothetical protein